jgi:hypothetical protein
MTRPSHSSRFYHPNNIGWGVQIICRYYRFKTLTFWTLVAFKPNCHYRYRMFNLKVDRLLSRGYFTSDAIHNGSAGMTLYYYMCSSWQDCCRSGEYRSCLSVSVESVDSECWCLKNAIFLRFHNAVNSGRTCIYFGKLFKNDVLRPL